MGFYSCHKNKIEKPILKNNSDNSEVKNIDCIELSMAYFLFKENKPNELGDIEKIIIKNFKDSIGVCLLKSNKDEETLEFEDKYFYKVFSGVENEEFKQKLSSINFEKDNDVELFSNGNIYFIRFYSEKKQVYFYGTHNFYKSDYSASLINLFSYVKSLNDSLKTYSTSQIKDFDCSCIKD